MALKPVTSNTTFYKPKEMTEGQKLAGYYQRSVESKEGYQPTHYFISKDGDKFGLNGTSRLNGIIEKNFTPGVYAELVYAGKKQGKGAMPAHTFEVAVDDEDIKLEDSPGADSAPSMTAEDIPL